MLSYQHSYHAGNFADVHKHLALLLLLRRLQQKETPLCYVDSHAGRGLYDLGSDEARKTAEADNGIRHLWPGGADVPAAVADYLALLAACNDTQGSGDLRFYPGSAMLARRALREQDKAILLELHPREFPALKQSVGIDRRFALHRRDAYEGLPALLPPPVRRGLVLIDPSYEVKEEYATVVRLLLAAWRRWPHAVYLLWLPLLSGGWHRQLLDAMSSASLPGVLYSEYQAHADAGGMQGSGLIVVNTPWQLDVQLAEAMQFVSTRLPQGGSQSRWLSPPA